MITRREFSVGAASVAVALTVPIVSSVEEYDGLLHFRFEHSGGKYWTEGFVYRETLLRMREPHVGYRLVILERFKEGDAIDEPL